jgi:hypothetical protein
MHQTKKKLEKRKEGRTARTETKKNKQGEEEHEKKPGGRN